MDASLNRVIRRFFHKSAQIIVQARDPPPQATGWTGKTDKWFSMESDELVAVRDLMGPWHGDKFPPLIIETIVSAAHLSKQRIVLEDGQEYHSTDKAEVVLERWVLEWRPQDGNAIDIAIIYKRAVVALRCLFSLLRVLPAWSLRQRVTRQKTPLKIGYRIIDGTNAISSRGRVGLSKKMGRERDPQRYQFAPIETSAGSLNLSVTYRPSAQFRTDDTEAVIARQLLEQSSDDRPPSTSSSVTSIGSSLRPVVSFTRPFKNSEIPRRNPSSTSIYQTTEPVPVPVPPTSGGNSLGQSISSTTSSAPRFSSSFARSNPRVRSISGTGSGSSQSSFEPGSIFHHSDINDFLKYVDDTAKRSATAFQDSVSMDSSLARFQLLKASSLGDSLSQLEASYKGSSRASSSPPSNPQSPVQEQRRRYSHLPAQPSRLSEQISPETPPTASYYSRTSSNDQGDDKEPLDDKQDDDFVFAFKV